MQLLDRLCEHYRSLSINEQNSFTFDKAIFRKDRNVGGLGLQGWEQEQINEQLEVIKRSGKIESIGNDSYRFTNTGKKHCETLGI